MVRYLASSEELPTDYVLRILQAQGNARDKVVQYAIGVIYVNFKCNVCICKLMLNFTAKFEDASGFKT